MIALCVICGTIIGGTLGGIAGNTYANYRGYSGTDRVACILIGAFAGAAIGGIGGYYAAPAVISATSVSGISLTVSAGVTLIPAQLTGQYHHVLSNPIMRALENHPLRGAFQRAESIVQAMTEAAHKGYQQWHRNIDNYMVNWLLNNRDASEMEFWQELYKMYNNKDMIARFGESVLEFIRQQIQRLR